MTEKKNAEKDDEVTARNLELRKRLNTLLENMDSYKNKELLDLRDRKITLIENQFKVMILQVYKVIQEALLFEDFIDLKIDYTDKLILKDVQFKDDAADIDDISNLRSDNRNIYYSVANNFSHSPGSRFSSNSNYSGEKFRSILFQLLNLAKRHNKNLVLDLDGTIGYGYGFLEEAFSGLTKEDFEILEILSNEEPFLVRRIARIVANEE